MSTIIYTAASAVIAGNTHLSDGAVGILLLVAGLVFSLRSILFLLLQKCAKITSDQP